MKVISFFSSTYRLPVPQAFESFVLSRTKGSKGVTFLKADTSSLDSPSNRATQLHAVANRNLINWLMQIYEATTHTCTVYARPAVLNIHWTLRIQKRQIKGGGGNIVCTKNLAVFLCHNYSCFIWLSCWSL